MMMELYLIRFLLVNLILVIELGNSIKNGSKNLGLNFIFSL